MAHMIPGVPAPEAPASERRVYEGFRSELPNTWTVIHSQRFLLPARRGAREEEGELDFLVLDPSRGALGLEVKGGRVQKTRRGWVSVDRDGKEHIVKDPRSAGQSRCAQNTSVPGGGFGFRRQGLSVPVRVGRCAARHRVATGHGTRSSSAPDRGSEGLSRLPDVGGSALRPLEVAGAGAY